MKKLFISSAVALALTSGAVMAEESGAFVGLGLSSTATSSGKGDSKATSMGIDYEIIAGYKQFFTDSFGLRYYAHFTQDYSRNKTGSAKAETNGGLTYGVNVDALYNFVSSDSSDFGIFAGARLGLSTMTGTVADEMSKDKDFKPTDFVAGINLGLRGTFAKSHGMEFGVLIPVKNHVYYDKGGIEMKDGTLYSTSLRYTYSF